MRKLLAALVALAMFLPSGVLAATIDELQAKIDALNAELSDLSDRVDKNERHTALDRINWYGDMRVKANTLHYNELTWNPGVMVDFDDFAINAMAGNFGSPVDPNSPLGAMLANYPNMAMAFNNGMVSGVGGFSMLGLDMGVAPNVKDMDNNVLYTTRVRLGMKAKVAKNVNFSGRLSMYKNWGDSTGVKVFDSWDAFTMDGTDGGNTSGDFMRVERAYFDWKNIGGSNFYLSIGRRPSTYGPPSQYRENEMRGGTPSGHLVHFNFDGITTGYKLSKLTGVEGQTVRFCYGQGYESKVGNGELFNNTTTKDTHLGGFNVDLINDGTNFVQLTAFAAQDVSDGFKGTFAFPTVFANLFQLDMASDLNMFPNMNFVTRYQPSTVIGDMKLGGIGFAREEWSGLSYFASLGWTRLESNGKAGMFGGMGSDQLYKMADVGGQLMPVPTGMTVNSDKHDGYGIYTGVQIPAPMGKLGLEYNYGSRYWTPFTQGADDMLGSKLATRGQVFEGYYVFDVNPNMFIKLAGLYYDYEYTGSGFPIGTPHKVEDVLSGKAFTMMPVADSAWDGNIALTVKF
ncbi:MAG: DUF3373 domain-containing protein [Desulfuromonas sp.]|nr:MAG: DUF3373 domain-containing protein [Desulfuromonas sp.]